MEPTHGRHRPLAQPLSRLPKPDAQLGGGEQGVTAEAQRGGARVVRLTRVLAVPPRHPLHALDDAYVQPLAVEHGPLLDV